MKLSSILLSLSALRKNHLSLALNTDDLVEPDIICTNGSLLTEGSQNYADIFRIDMVNTLPFLQTISKNGMYCKCGLGYTGIDCATPYEICKDDSICFHGAPCVKNFVSPNNTIVMDDEKYHCACSQTTYPINESFEGKSCEYRVTSYCELSDPTNIQDDDRFPNDVPYDVSASGEWYCTNGADCQSGIMRPSEKCDCTDNFYGLHCEQREEQPCDLTCSNGGVCKNGAKDYTNLSNSLQEHFEPDVQYDTHCICPTGFTGRQCEIDISICGSGSCLNGGVCTDGGVCDCTDASKMMEDGTVLAFAGSSCESQVTSFCTVPSGFDQMSHFCTNDGKCAEDYWGACECGADHIGPRCEFTVQNLQVCDLQCQNGGTCFFGDGLPSSKANNVDDASSAMIAQTSPANGNDKMHCKCPDGYFGNLCNVKVCGDYEHFCLNTGTCLKSNDSYTCKCAGNTTDTVFAGANCNYAATTFCEGPGASLDSFCTNQGICKSIVEVVGNHPGCECAEEFTGSYCEVSTILSGENRFRDSPKTKVLWYIFVSIAVLFVYVIGLLLVHIRRSRINKMRKQTPIDSSQNIATNEEIDDNMKMSDIYDIGQYQDMNNGHDEYVMQTVEIS